MYWTQGNIMNDLKAKVAHAALEYIEDHRIIGVGTGTTVEYFIRELAGLRARIDGCVASSLATAQQLRAVGLVVLDLNVVDALPIYIDGADEVNAQHAMLKGAGGALAREKVLASVAHNFLCIVDETKLVQQLGSCPVVIEVLPIARGFVAREVVKLGGTPVYRFGELTDNGNILLDVHHLSLLNPTELEDHLNTLPGVVENGVFAKRRADHVLVATKHSVKSLRAT